MGVRMIDPTSLALVAAGGAAGGLARVGFTGLVTRRVGDGFPWGTLVVNVTGAFAIGIAFGLADAHVAADQLLWQLGVSGFLGSYTTVSSFSLQTLSLVHAGRPKRAAANVVLSMSASLGAAALGLWIAA